MNTTIPRTAIVAAALLVAAACGADDPGGAGPTTTAAPTSDPTSSDSGTLARASAEFCDAFAALDAAFKDAPEDPAAMEAFVAEQVDPNLERVRAELPVGVEEEVTTLVEVVEEVVAGGDDDLFISEPFSTAAATVYGGLDDLCDIPVVEVGMVDFGYEGVPATLPAGPTSIVVQNDSAAGEFHQIELVKLADGVDLPPEEILGAGEDELEGVIDTFGGAAAADAGLGGGTIVELTPGRWVYGCFIPMGSIDGADGTGHPHWEEGMYGELTVE